MRCKRSTQHLGRKLFYDIHEIQRHLKSIERFCQAVIDRLKQNYSFV